MKNCLTVMPLDWIGLDMFAGVLRYFSEIMGKPYRLWQYEPNRGFPASMVTSRRYDGFIIPVSVPMAARKALSETGKPTVLVNIADPVLTSRTTNVVSLWIDNFDIGRLGAEHFLESDRYKSFGFIQLQNSTGDYFYSGERESAFRGALARHGFKSSSFPGPDGDYSDSALARWIRSMPKPAAVMAVNDQTAVRAMKLCRRMRLSVPEDVAILGVDNIASFAQSKEISLSSVKPDFVRIGYIAAKELVRMLSRNRQSAFKEIVVPVSELIPRGSTTHAVSSNALADAAMAFIRSNSRRPLSPGDVAAHFSRTRRLIDMRMRERFGKTLWSAIADSRTDEVKRMLDASEPAGRIAAELGFGNANQMRRAFARHTGTTITEFLRRPPQHEGRA